MEQYNDILARMKNTYREYSGAEVEEATDTDMRLRVLAGEIFAMQMRLDKLKKQMFVDTATGENLDRHGMERGLERKPALKSQGRLTFYLSSANSEYDIEIPAGTICSTSGDTPIRFVTLERGIIASGDLSVEVNAQALDPGIAGNTAAGRITVVVTPGIAEISVRNDAGFLGGSDAENDELFRERILDTYKNTSTGSNAAYYKLLAMSHNGVYSASVVPRPNNTRGKVDIYVAGDGCLLDSQTIAQIQAEIDELREINVDATVKSPSYYIYPSNVYIAVEDGYSFEEVSARVQSAVLAKFSRMGVGQSIYLSDIGAVIEKIDGVRNYIFKSSDSIDLPCDPDEMLSLAVFNVHQLNG